MVHVIVDLAIRFPKLAGFIGLMVSILFSIIGVSSYLENQKIASVPEETTLSSIATYLNTNDRYWVNVKDGSFDCQSIYYDQVGSSVNTEIFLVSSDESIVMLVTYTQELSCESITAKDIQGVAYRMSDKHKSLLAADRRLNNYSNRTIFVELCTTCSQKSSVGLIILSAIFVPLGLSFYPLVIWGKRYRKKTNVVNNVDDIFDK